MIELQAPGGSVSMLIDESAGARIVSASFDGWDVVGAGVRAVGAPDWYRGIFPLAPWAGTVPGGMLRFDGEQHRLADAAHGLVAEALWTVEESEPGRVELTCSLEEHPSWPFGGVCTITAHVDDTGATIALSMAATRRSLPCAPGLHPWFTRHAPAGQLEVTWPAVERFVPDRDGPWRPADTLGRAPWDDLFRLDGDPVLSWPGGPTLRLISDTDRWVRYDASADALCIEPWTCDPGSFGAGRALRLARTERATVTLRMELVPRPSDSQPE